MEGADGTPPSSSAPLEATWRVGERGGTEVPGVPSVDHRLGEWEGTVKLLGDGVDPSRDFQRLCDYVHSLATTCAPIRSRSHSGALGLGDDEVGDEEDVNNPYENPVTYRDLSDQEGGSSYEDEEEGTTERAAGEDGEVRSCPVMAALPWPTLIFLTLLTSNSCFPLGGLT